MRLTQNKQNFE